MYDVVVVGGASAGLAAAIYTSRQGLSTLLLTKDIGGQAILTSHIENYPGFKSIMGLELMQVFAGQAKSFGTEIKYEEVLGVEQIDNWFKVKTYAAEYETKTVILSFGKTPRNLGVPGEERLVGKGISHCAICDGPLFKRRDVAVVGWGDPALDAIEMLCRIARKVYLIHRGSEMLANDALADNCRQRDNLETINNTVVIEIRGNARVESIMVQDQLDHKTKELKVDGVFVETGYVSKTGFLKDLVSLSDHGEIIVDRNCATSLTGVFAAGDVTDTAFKQVVISAGDGAKAGLSAYNYIQKLLGRPSVRADWKSKAEAD